MTGVARGGDRWQTDLLPPLPSTSRRGAPRGSGCVRALALSLLLLLLPSAHAWGAGSDGRFDRRSSDDFVLYQDVGIDHRTGWRGSDQFEREVLASLESAHDALRALLGIEPRQRVYVTIYDPVVFDQAFAGLAAFPTAGFYQGSIRVRGDVRMTDELARVLHHEYVHAALDAAAPSLVLPALVNEGLAEWFARRTLRLPILAPGESSLLWSAGRSGGWIPLSMLLEPNFVRLGPNDAVLAYVESQAFIAYLVRHHGERALLEFWRVLVRTGELDHALVRAFGSNLTEIEGGMRKELGG